MQMKLLGDHVEGRRAGGQQLPNDGSRRFHDSGAQRGDAAEVVHDRTVGEVVTVERAGEVSRPHRESARALGEVRCAAEVPGVIRRRRERVVRQVHRDGRIRGPHEQVDHPE